MSWLRMSHGCEEGACSSKLVQLLRMLYHHSGYSCMDHWKVEDQCWMLIEGLWMKKATFMMSYHQSHLYRYITLYLAIKIFILYVVLNLNFSSYVTTMWIKSLFLEKWPVLRRSWSCRVKQYKHVLLVLQTTFMLFCKVNVIAIIHFRYRKKSKKFHRFTNNLQGLQKVMVKDFSWNIIPWNALLFEKTLKQYKILDSENYGFILNTCHDTAKRADSRVGFPVIFSRLRWPIEPKFSQVCYFIHKLWYKKCGTWTTLFTESVYWL